MVRVTWLIELQVLPDMHHRLREAVLRAGDVAIEWDDDWWTTKNWPFVSDAPVVFHGSLENAARIRDQLSWRPGSYCNTEAFRCSAWHPRAERWILNSGWRILPADQFVANSNVVLDEIGSPKAVFIRPDSALKPFAGRVLRRDEITLKAIDYGFYFDDASIPVIVAPIRSIKREWRFVVVNGNVVTGSAYEAMGRRSLAHEPRGLPWDFASTIAAQLQPPDPVYVMDVCEADGGLYLMELNPFSGADLYACNADEVVAAVDAAVIDDWRAGVDS